jgi:hypothetical protein
MDISLLVPENLYSTIESNKSFYQVVLDFLWVVYYTYSIRLHTIMDISLLVAEVTASINRIRIAGLAVVAAAGGDGVVAAAGGNVVVV